MLYGPLSTKVDKCSLYTVEGIVLGCASSCQVLGVTSRTMKMQMSVIILANLCCEYNDKRDEGAEALCAPSGRSTLARFFVSMEVD